MLITRIFAALIFAPALAGLVYVGGLPLAIACLVIVWLMLWEFVTMTLGPGQLYLKVVAYILTTMVAVTVLDWAPPISSDLVLPAGTLLVFSAVLVRPAPLETSVFRVGALGLGVVYCGALMPYLARLRDLDQGLALALMALFCTWAADTMAYFTGRFLGRNKLYPAVSPGKTLEGAIGGWVGAVAVAFFIRFWAVDANIDLSPLHTALIGTVAAVFGIIGDLCESMLKRSVGAKESGHLIPGHGGVLDRFDAAMFVAPAIYIYVTVLVQPTGGG
ncbi:MAG: phosphatidate cytidylyltransferase [Myxococcota bacterium]